MKRWQAAAPQQFRARLRRPRSVFLLLVAMLAAYYLIFNRSNTQARVQVVPYYPHQGLHQSAGNSIFEQGGTHDSGLPKEPWDLTAAEIKDWKDPTDREDPNDIELGYETDGKERGFGDLAKLQREKDMRKEWRHAYAVSANLPTSNLIYGNTLSSLEYQDDRSEEFSTALRYDADVDVDFSDEKPVRYNPYPEYNGAKWKKDGHGAYVSCIGANNDVIEDPLVFKGRPHEWPNPSFGGYDVLNLDPNLCWERDTRLGPYGLKNQFKKDEHGNLMPLEWDKVNWGDLQRACVHKNAQRFDMNKDRVNKYLDVYPGLPRSSGPLMTKNSFLSQRDDTEAVQVSRSSRGSANGYVSEQRTAVLLRSYTGHRYTDNDRMTIRALITELSLKSGGEYEVFLLVQVKDNGIRIFDDPDTYQQVLKQNVPQEFHGITILWNDENVWSTYTELKDEEERSVHTAQWLSVQKFSQEHPQYDYVWNWEMDFRFIGHHYELLQKLDQFAKKQPRKGLWERNERWYIPEYHGPYETEFRKDIESRYGNATIWGPPNLSFIKPVGPKPPVPSPGDDNYEWGVGEDADMITLGPIFNPVGSNWVIANHVWGYTDGAHKPTDLPRRTTIVTQSRVSKKLLDLMHVENLRGNHVASEMTPQTVALLHGLKTVYAPHPVFMDRDWTGRFLAKWFTPGENGESGGRGSPMGWGRERRYQGSTWYYRAEPPNRLFNNWMGWRDTDIGGRKWEETNGRPCLPTVLLHHVKNTETTYDWHKTGFDLAYG
ncbi:hypothetical protein BGZ63DRAFT_403759 [Mariannaea sp. PMI_226]|nr:hypothetical protein BGZ63DRAFT_403759 [Mariannaea sp. PMI_226]